MTDPTNRRSVQESEVVNPADFRALALGVSSQVLVDSQALVIMLDDPSDLGRALGIISAAGTLGYLLQMGIADLERLPLSKAECERLIAIPKLSRHLHAVRSGLPDLSTRRQVADELSERGLRYTVCTAGVIAWDAQGRRVADRVVAVGTRTELYIELSEVFRTVISANGTSLMVWLWRPQTNLVITEYDRKLADDLRLAAAAGLRLQVEDLLILGHGMPVSMAVADQWR
jgi:DNA repair protein RadC